MPKVSVLLPVYNAERYVGNTIRSILDQTFSDFELIIINDGSSDDSLRVIESFVDARIKVISQENQGLTASLNLAARHANGEYLARIDADDLCRKDRFEIQVQYLDNHPHIGVLGSAVEYIDEQGRVLGRSFPVCHPRLLKVCLRSFSILAHPSIMMRCNQFLSVGGYVNVVGAEDLHLWRKFLRCGILIANLPDPLVSYRLLSSAISERVRSERYSSLLNDILVLDDPSDGKLKELSSEYEKCERGSTLRMQVFQNSLLQRLYVRLRYNELYCRLLQSLGCLLSATIKYLQAKVA